MSSQKGNASRTRAQKHKNSKVFKNDMHDTSHTTKKINSLEFYGLCLRCKDIIEWKVKYKKYKPLTTAKKCVKCLEKKVKMAYYIVCEDCCTNLKVCSKCAKSSDELEYAESEMEKRHKEEMFIQELKSLSERKRRKFLRLLEKGEFSKEDILANVERKDGDEDDDDSDLVSDDEDKEAGSDQDEDEDEYTDIEDEEE